MSTFDYTSFARPAGSSIPSGMFSSAGHDPKPVPHIAPRAPTEPRSSSEALPSADDGDSLDAPLPDVAKLHTAAERSMLPAGTQPRTDVAAGSSAAPRDAAEKSPRADSNGAELHRVRDVRREQGVSIKRASQHLGCSVEEARRQEEPTTDLTLSQLVAWQKLCEVPLADLLVEPDCDLSAPVLQRARMVRVMKTVQAILERTGQQSVKRLGQTLVNQLVELMPELKGVSSWHAVERRHSCNQNARILESNYLRPEGADPRD